MDLPKFKYHPDPVATGAFIESNVVCACCQKARGYIYRGPTYSVEDLNDTLCPWCIADGSVATRFNAEFVDSYEFEGSGLNSEVVEEVTRRTPSYVAWQQEQWLHHCGDACEFHGFPAVTEVEAASSVTIRLWMERNDLTEEDWDHSVAAYAADRGIGFYKFMCRKCDLTLYASDWD